MDVKDLFKSEYLVWDDVASFGAVERNAVILDDGTLVPNPYDSKKQDLVIMLQLVKNKEIYKFRVNKASYRNLNEAYGSDTVNWREKTVRVDKVVYKNDKQGIVISPYSGDKPKEKAKAGGLVNDLLSNPEVLASVSKIIGEMKTYKK